MGTLNLSIGVLVFNDNQESNNPSIRLFDLFYKKAKKMEIVTNEEKPPLYVPDKPVKPRKKRGPNRKK